MRRTGLTIAMGSVSRAKRRAETGPHGNGVAFGLADVSSGCSGSSCRSRVLSVATTISCCLLFLLPDYRPIVGLENCEKTIRVVC